MAQSRRLQAYAARLQKERARLLVLLTARPTVEAESVRVPGDHPAEAAGLVYDQEEMLTIRTLLLRQLAEVDAALQRLRDGTYGRCAVCGMPVERARLRALPTARLRLPCQQMIERAPSRHPVGPGF